MIIMHRTANLQDVCRFALVTRFEQNIFSRVAADASGHHQLAVKNMWAYAMQPHPFMTVDNNSS